MANNSIRPSIIHQQFITVAGFLGGVSFAALVLILQASKETFSPVGWGLWGTAYFDVLITLVAGVSVLFVMAAISSLGLAGGTVSKDATKLDKIASDNFVLGFLGLLVVVPLLLLPFFWGATLVIAVVEAILLARAISR